MCQKHLELVGLIVVEFTKGGGLNESKPKLYVKVCLPSRETKYLGE